MNCSPTLNAPTKDTAVRVSVLYSHLLWYHAVDICQDDQNQHVIPIIVGVTIAAVLLVALLAFLIGRRRNRGNYHAI